MLATTVCLLLLSKGLHKLLQAKKKKKPLISKCF